MNAIFSGFLGFLPGPFEVFILIFILALGISLLPLIFYLITLQNTLEKISPENRTMPPGNVWLILIPIFGMAWQFVVVNNMATSLAAEFKSRGITVDEPRPGYSIGIAYCILLLTTIIPFLGFLAGIGGFVCWIIYWVKINDYKLKLS